MDLKISGVAQLAFAQLYPSFHSKQDILVHTVQWEQCGAHVIPPKYAHTPGREVLTSTMLLLASPVQAELWIPSIG